MGQIRIVWGTGTGPTELAAYDAALQDANVHNYNLISLSSVIPPEVPIKEIGSAPDLGACGSGLYVVEASETATSGTVAATLAWARSTSGYGIFYEAAGNSSAEQITSQALAGINHGIEQRDNEFASPVTQSKQLDVEQTEDTAGAVVVLAVYDKGIDLIQNDS